MIPPRKSSAAHAAPNPWQRLSRWFVLFASVLGTVFHGQAEVGLDDSPLFTIDTAYVVSVGSSNSSLFTLDTRYGLGVRSNQSGLLILDTRSSANTGIGAALDFTLDTRGAVVVNAEVNGNVSATGDGALSGVFVQALQSGILRASTFTDNSGHYQLALAAGTYELRASKTGRLTGIRSPLTLSVGQTITQNFSLDSPPPMPVVEVTVRPPPPTTPRPIPAGSNLKLFSNGSFQSGSLDPNKMTVVMTHGWKGNPDGWPTTMAQRMVNAGVSANIVAWDWRDGANPFANFDPLSVSWGTPLQGEALGISLYGILGSDYSHPIHFIGHSLGTLVNAAAANYLHGDAPKNNPAQPWLPTRTHVTLLDEAEAAPVLGMNTFSAGFTRPIPARAAWVDNYYSIFGFHRDGAVNVELTQGRLLYAYILANPFNPLRELEYQGAVHGYPCGWYGLTIANPNGCLLGNKYSFERMNEAPNFPSQTAFPYDSRWEQDTIFHPELDLIAKPSYIGGVGTVAGNVTAFGVQTYKGTVTVVNGALQRLGDVAADIGEKNIGGADAFNAYSLKLLLRTTRPVDAFRAAAGKTNNPAYAWLSVDVPTNAALMQFDFALSGDGGDDYLVAGVNGTNIFALETRFIPQDTTLTSGGIDFSGYAGQTVELYFGVTGGTSTNASLTVDGIRFYSIDPPILSVSTTAGQVVISWPVAASGYVLESATTLDSASSWNTVTNIPAMIDFENFITNAMDQTSRFYRLKR